MLLAPTTCVILLLAMPTKTMLFYSHSLTKRLHERWSKSLRQTILSNAAPDAAATRLMDWRQAARLTLIGSGTRSCSGNWHP
jgi:hypothetical protein